MVVTTTSMTAVSVSMRSAHENLRSPETTQFASATCASWPKPTCTNTIHERIMEKNKSAVVISSARREPSTAGRGGTGSATEDDKAACGAAADGTARR